MNDDHLFCHIYGFLQRQNFLVFEFIIILFIKKLQHIKNVFNLKQISSVLFLCAFYLQIELLL